MKEVYRSPHLAELSAIQALLKSEAIESIVFDHNASFMYGPSQFLSPRLMVADEDYEQAVELIQEAGFGK